MAEYQSTSAPEAFDQLVARHLRRVRNLAYRMTLCHTSADDVAQETFLKILTQPGSYSGRSQFSTWLYRVALNTCKEFLRREATQKKHVRSEEVVSYRDTQAQPHVQPEQQALGTELTKELQSALSMLSTDLRAALVLTAIEQLPAKQAAAVAGCTTTTMYWRVHQARKQLKSLLGDYLAS
ncbi:MAG: RNA polymerase sigma factor [Lacipirellulaceae bacterium]